MGFLNSIMPKYLILKYISVDIANPGIGFCSITGKVVVIQVIQCLSWRTFSKDVLVK